MGAFKRQQVEMMECPACDGCGEQPRKPWAIHGDPDTVRCYACSGRGEVDVDCSGPWTEAEAREHAEQMRAEARYDELREEGLI